MTTIFAIYFDSECAPGFYQTNGSCEVCIQLTATPYAINLIDGDTKTCQQITSDTKNDTQTNPPFDLGINNPCVLTVNQVFTLSVTMETLATCDDLRNVLYLGRPPPISDQLSLCDITNEKQSGEKRLCVMRCECRLPGDQCSIKFRTGVQESKVVICEITAS